jgi:hypothetical protein
VILEGQVQALSVGHAVDAALPDWGVVHSAFPHAVNFLVRGDLWTLLAEEKADLPFGIRVALPELEGLGLQREDVVQVRAGFLKIGPTLTIDCRAAERWSPAKERKIAHGLERRLEEIADAIYGRSWPHSAVMARALKAALRTPAKLGEALAKVVGCGPGATPSGDDVLVGMMAVLKSRHSRAEGARDAELLRRALFPLLPTTTDLSAHLLGQAAQGFFSRDLHELISALISESYPGQLREKLSRVLGTGATSGADMCEGLLALAPGYFIQPRERIAA